MKISVTHSAVIEAPIERVWSVLRDFSGQDRWHPAVAESQMESNLDGDVVGAVRRIRLDDGSELREQLLKHSDREHTFSYCILDSSLPLVDFLATVRLKPITDGNQTFLDWRSRFFAPASRAEELENLISQRICEAGFTALRMFLAEQAKPFQGRPVPEAPAVSISTKERLPSKAIVATSAGGPEVLQLTEQSVPPPGPSEVRIRHTIVAVNFLDIMQRRGTLPGLDLPGVPGFEGVGEVIDVGEQVNGLFPGDRVAYLSRNPGAYTQIRCVEDATCIPLPHGISDLVASMLLKGSTAGLLLGKIFQAAPQSTILIQSVAGGLGHLLAQWACSMEMTVIGTVSSMDKARFSRDHGCDHPIVVTDGDRFAADIMRFTNGRGMNYYVHSSGAKELESALNCLARCGHCAVLGNRDGLSIDLDINFLRKRSLTVSAPVIFDYIEDRIYLQRLAHQLFAKIQNKSIVPAIETFPVSKAAEAHAKIESRQTTGAVVLEV